jgi:excisionase family DNA binding protein
MTITLPPAVETALLEAIRAQALDSVIGEMQSVRLLSRETAAALLEVSPRYFDELIARHQITPVRLGPRAVRYRLSDLRQFSE